MPWWLVAQVIGWQAAATLPTWDGARQVRSMRGWCEVGGGLYSIGRSLDTIPDDCTSGRPFFVLTKKEGVGHVACVHVCGDGAPGYVRIATARGYRVDRLNRYIEKETIAGGSLL